jgi:hypothetical protein
LGVDADASAQLAYGVLPSPAAGLAAHVTLRPPGFWRVRASTGAFWPQAERADGGASTHFTLVYAGLALCPVAFQGLRRVSIDLCAGALAGAFGADGSAFSGTSHTGTATFLDIVGTVTLRVPLVAPLSATLGASVGIALSRDEVVYEDASGATRNLYVAPLVNAMGQLGLGVTVP